MRNYKGAFLLPCILFLSIQSLSAQCTPGDSCDDGDPCTWSDVYDVDCNCTGTYSGDPDGDGVCEALDVCNDFDDNVDFDGDGIPFACDFDEQPTLAEILNDNDLCSSCYLDIRKVEKFNGDILYVVAIDESLPECQGRPYILFEEDGSIRCLGYVCGGYISTLIEIIFKKSDYCNSTCNNVGQPCDDGNECSEGDVINTDCNCVGFWADDDGDGICNANDVCPNGNDNDDSDQDGIPNVCDPDNQVVLLCDEDGDGILEPCGTPPWLQYILNDDICNTCITGINKYKLGNEDRYVFYRTYINSDCLDEGREIVIYDAEGTITCDDADYNDPFCGQTLEYALEFVEPIYNRQLDCNCTGYYDDNGDCISEYCLSVGYVSNTTYIGQVDIQEMPFYTGNNRGYAYFSDRSYTFQREELIPLTLYHRPSQTNRGYWRIWIDYNQDKDFNDIGENVYNGEGTSPVLGSFTIPSDVLLGTTRMRISMSNLGGINLPSACTSQIYGEVEDYNVVIKNQCTSNDPDADDDGVCDSEDVCPGFPDDIDSNNNGIPDGCETPQWLQEILDNDICNNTCIDGIGRNVYDNGVTNYVIIRNNDRDCGDQIYNVSVYNFDGTLDCDGLVGYCSEELQYGLYGEYLGSLFDSNEDCSNNDPYLTGNTGFETCPSPWVDTDNDGICNAADVCQWGDDYQDQDNDGIPDACDDNECICTQENNPVCGSDGVTYSNACFATCAGVSYTFGECEGGSAPYLTGNSGFETCPSPWSDTDNDGICDAADICQGADDYADMDGDGIPDGCDNDNSTSAYLTGNSGFETCPIPWLDTDFDGICDAADVCQGADDYADMDGDGIPDGCDTNSLTRIARPERIVADKIAGRKVNLTWAANEIHSPTLYTIQHSIDGQNYSNLLTKNPRANGEIEVYYGEHRTPSIGNNFYRLKIDYVDKASEYFEDEPIFFAPTGIRAFPNPTKDILHINLEEIMGVGTTIKLFSIHGVELNSMQVNADHDEVLQLDMSTYNNGLYTLTIKPDGFKAIVQKIAVANLY